MNQLDLFTPAAVDPNTAQAESWRICFPEWPGPEVGGIITMSCMTIKNGNRHHYVYCEPARIIAMKGHRLQVRLCGTLWETVEHRRGKPAREPRRIPSPNSGLIFDVELKDIWPPVALLRDRPLDICEDGHTIQTIAPFVSPPIAA